MLLPRGHHLLHHGHGPHLCRSAWCMRSAGQRLVSQLLHLRSVGTLHASHLSDDVYPSVTSSSVFAVSLLQFHLGGWLLSLWRCTFVAHGLRPWVVNGKTRGSKTVLCCLNQTTDTQWRITNGLLNTVHLSWVIMWFTRWFVLWGASSSFIKYAIKLKHSLSSLSQWPRISSECSFSLFSLSCLLTPRSHTVFSFPKHCAHCNCSFQRSALAQNNFPSTSNLFSSLGARACAAPGNQTLDACVVLCWVQLKVLKF